ncbi:MAG: GntR family transcriptional regulator [Sphingomonas sp.]
MTANTPDHSLKKARDLRQRGVSRYVQLAGLFRGRIETGTWGQGERMPTVGELAEECGVARETIRQSLGILEQEGLIKRYRAKGTFVTGSVRSNLWCELHTDYFGLLQAREGVEIELIAEERRIQIAGPVDFGLIQPAYRHLRRRHWRQGEPYMIADVYIDERLIDRIPRSAFTTKTALKLVADIPGIDIADVEQIMTIGAADISASEALQMPMNAPVAQVNRYAMGRESELLIFVRGVYRADVIRLSIKSK